MFRSATRPGVLHGASAVSACAPVRRPADRTAPVFEYARTQPERAPDPFDLTLPRPLKGGCGPK